MKYLKTLLASVAALLPMPVLAVNVFEEALTKTKTVATNAGIQSEAKLPQIIGNIINVLLGFLGIVFLVLLIYAGFKWMTAQGDESKVKEARAMISQAVVGLIIIVAAFAISSFVLESLVKVTA